MLGSSSTFYIGYDTTFFHGTIDDIRIHPQALSQQELVSVMQGVQPGKGASENVIINVTPVGDPLTAVDDTQFTSQDTPILIDVLANDIEPDGDGLVVLVGSPISGLAAISSTQVLYTPPAGLFNFTDTFTYTISDGSYTSTAAVNTGVYFELTASSPAHHDLDIDAGTSISLIFNAIPDPNTVSTQSIAVFGSQGGYSWTYNLAGTNLVITPSTSFFPGEEVWLALGKGVLNTNGVQLSPVHLQFTTAASGGENFCAYVFTDINAGLQDVYLSGAAWGDYDNDGDLDILLTGFDGSASSRIYRNDSGTFTDINAGLTGVYYGSADWGDYDNDGDLDILLAGQNGSGQSRVYRNDGGIFTDISAGLFGVYYSSVDWGDYDNDGDLDILLAGYDGSSGRGLVYRNDGGTFTDIGAGLPGAYYGSADWGDYDNDGDLDILITGASTLGILSRIYRNDGGTFTDIAAGLQGVNISSAAWGDYDNDGDLDVLLTGYNAPNAYSLIYNNNAGVFTDIAAGLQTLYYSSVDWGDFDNDGDLDILQTGQDGANAHSIIYRNDAGTFTDIGAGLTGVKNSSVDWGDFDDDGDLDILLTGNAGSATQSLIYRNAEGCAIVDDEYAMNDNSILSVPWYSGVLANDGSFGYTATLVTSTTNGLLDLQPDGSFIYTPTTNYTGTDGFIYQFWSQPNYTAAVTITVALFDDAPVTLGEAYTTTEDTPLLVPAPGVLGNDSDPEGGTISATLETPPLNGVVVLDADGAFVYTPTLDYNGPDSFVYQAKDGPIPAFAYWPLDDGLSPSADKSGSEFPLSINGATFTNSTPLTLTSSTAALHFDGVDDYSFRHGINLIDKSFTIAFWAKRDSTGTDQDVVRQYYGGKYLIIGFRSSDVFTCEFDTADYLETPAAHTDTANWHHYACSYDAATNQRTIYIDGVAVISDTAATQFESSFGFIYLSYSNYFHGTLDDVRIHQLALSQEDLQKALQGVQPGRGSSEVVALTITPAGDPVTAIDDTQFAAQDTPVLIDVLANDLDPDGDAVLVQVGDPLSGTAAISNTRVLYTPPAGQINITDTFTYTISDGSFTSTAVVNSGVYFQLAASNPAHQDLDVAAGSAISMTFSAIPDPSTISPTTIAVYGSQGAYTWTEALTANSLVITPSSDFFPGEEIRIAAGIEILNSQGLPLKPENLQFTAAASGPDYCLRIFTEVDFGLLGVGRSDAAWGDYDNDGDLDILLTGQETGGQTRIYRNDGGSFTDIAAGLPGSIFGAVDWGDYDNDGDLDFLLTGSNSGSRIFRNDGGVFIDIGAGLTDVTYSDVEWGDYDNDADLDILLTGISTTGTRQSKIYRNDSGVFSDINAGLLGLDQGSAGWGDFDKDGDLDVLLTGFDGATGQSLIYRNDNGVFTDINANLLGVYNSDTDWGDYDNDGDLDILLTGLNAGGNSMIYRNDGGVFTDTGPGPSLYYGNGAFGDFDNDGDLDILLTGYDVSVHSYLFRNDSGILTDVGAGLKGTFQGSLDWGDYDGDGDLDILRTGWDGVDSISIIYRNEESCEALNDNYGLAEDTVLNVPAPTGVLYNDVANGYTATLVTPPANGNLAFDPSGSFVYTPDPNFYGQDSFVYQLTSWSQVTATTSLYVSPMDDGPPSAYSDTFTTTVNTTLNVSAPGVIGNDISLDGGLTASLAGFPANGAVNLQPDGSFFYIPIPDFVGSDQFTYKLTDLDGDTATAVVHLVVADNLVHIPLIGPGWNNFGWPAATTPVTTGLSSIAGFYQTIYGYDAGDPGDPWKVYDVSLPAHLNDLTELEFGGGYWITVTQDVTISLGSGLSAPDTSGSGRLLAATGFLPPSSAYGTVTASPGITPTTGMTVTAYVNGNACGQAQTVESAGQIWYLVDTASIVEEPGCGTNGAVVSFGITGYTVVQTDTWESGVAQVSLVLTPAAPKAVIDLQIQRSGPHAALSWTAVMTNTAGGPTDIAAYLVFRDTDIGVQTLTPLTSTAYLTFTDPGAAGGAAAYFYIVQAQDIHGTRSAESKKVGIFPFELVPGSAASQPEIPSSAGRPPQAGRRTPVHIGIVPLILGMTRLHLMYPRKPCKAHHKEDEADIRFE